MVTYSEYFEQLSTTFFEVLSHRDSWYLGIFAVLMPILLYFINKKVKSVWLKALFFALMMPVPTLWCIEDCGWLMWPMVMPGFHWFFGVYILPILAVYYLVYLAVFVLAGRWIMGNKTKDHLRLYFVGAVVTVTLLFLGYFNYLLAQNWTKLECGDYCIEGQDYATY